MIDRVTYKNVDNNGVNIHYVTVGEGSVLQVHGLDDPAVSKDGVCNTRDWVNQEYSLITYPEVGHIPHMQVPERVNTDLRKWLEDH